MASSAATVCLNARDLLARRAAQTPGVISFAGGLPDPALFPKRQLTRAFISQEGASFDLGRQFRHARARNLCIRPRFSAVPAADIEAGVSRIARALRHAHSLGRPHL